jgi:hypothetical protein
MRANAGEALVTFGEDPLDLVLIKRFLFRGLLIAARLLAGDGFGDDFINNDRHGEKGLV